ncbi:MULTISPECIES: ABC transporter ATP-binding protein [unclassified Clostridium]|uniref:ABC transporter ATP-binding protein n=1 Tax=unclassified Clostridium TaxID=2614128 RepID=UPI00029867D1|nr:MULTISPECIES: ABC transporter ATP-binding protein [unclassified Clostridium]EKQ56831.1 MAG: ABC-type nitrate/sulfonate/bicarbonate transport system, ATPase component [Clostridium sp. Maddingley MBC34-26]
MESLIEKNEVEERSVNCSVELKDVNLIYKNGKQYLNVLNDIDLKLFDDDFVCVLGPSGCGKTSLLNAIAGYNTDISGQVLINGVPHTKPNPDVGVVFQQPNIFPWLSVEKNVEFGLKMKGIPKKERAAIVNHYINLVGLDKARKLLPHQLSGGMKQRAAIARTLATDSKVVLLDEPFSALDALTRESMQKHLKKIWKDTNKCFFFITHDVEEAILLSNRIIVMNANPGRIVSDFRNPLQQYDNNSFKKIRSSEEFGELRDSLIKLIQGNDLESED